MKKSYVKPQVYFEDFRLSASIAAGCTPGIEESINSTQGQCGFKYGNEILFMTGIAGCTKQIQDGEEAYCYHTPTDGYIRLFISA